MKKTILFFILFTSLAGVAQAQTTSQDPTIVKEKISPHFERYVLYVFKSEDQYEEVLISNRDDINKLIDSNDIESIDVFKGESATQAYGSKAENGAVVLHFKKGKFTRLKKDSNHRFIDGN